MIIDLFHNKIVKDTATDAFVDSFNRVLVPMLEDKYGDALEAVTMYEDYLADGFTYEGEWYYPLSVKLAGEPTFTSWVKWPVTKKTFKNSIPYAFVGEGDVEFSFAGFLPAGFADKLQGRAIDYDRSAIKLTVQAATDDATLLVGKYSQTFIDELARQITQDLCRAASVKDLGTSTMELELVFAPGTYLEHTSESVTYRRLLLVDKGCQARDFWVKWTRLDGNGGFRVSDTVSAANVKFEVGEDVKQKIREKEYRFLAGANPSKYQAAMGKRNVTEWRDIVKRAIKRGELTKVEPVVAAPSIHVMKVQPAPTVEAVDTRIQDDMSEQLRALLDSFGVSTPAAEPEEEPDTSYDVVAELARSVLGQTAPAEETVDETDEAPFDTDEPTEEEEEFEVEIEIEDGEDEEAPFDVEEPAEEAEEEPTEEAEEEYAEEIAEQTVEVAVDEPVAEDPRPEKIVHFNFDAIEEEIVEEEPEEEFFSMGEDSDEEESLMAEPKPSFDEAAIRREIEEKLRREYEAEARARAEREAEALRLEHERLREENERLAKLAREAEEQRLREDEARRLAEEERLRELEAKRAEEARQRAELEAKMRLEAEERARIAEAARMAVEEQKRLEAERAAKLERERQEALEREAEAARQAEEARRLEEERRLIEERRREEEERRRRQEEAAKARPTIVTKQAKIMFRYSVDVNVLKRIKEVIEKTLVDNDKQTLNIHIKAYPVDSSSISLEIKLPDTEMELLVSMMKALGGASLGITKIILE